MRSRYESYFRTFLSQIILNKTIQKIRKAHKFEISYHIYGKTPPPSIVDVPWCKFPRTDRYIRIRISALSSQLSPAHPKYLILYISQNYCSASMTVFSLPIALSFFFFIFLDIIIMSARIRASLMGGAVRSLLRPSQPPRPSSATSTTAWRAFRVTAASQGANNHLKSGDGLPNVVFKTRESTNGSFDWVDKYTSDLFKGKRIVLFALPGAFTPTCSSTHLPGYERDYDAIRACDVDEVYCLSVNDAFVMREWGIAQNAKKVKLLPDGAALFTEGMRMDCDWISERGFGRRSWRYSMVVKDMVIEKVFVERDFEQNTSADPFEVSDSSTMLEYLRSV